MPRNAWVVSKFEILITPKAFANLSPGFERLREPWGTNSKSRPNPERVKQLANPFRVQFYSCDLTQGCRCAPTLG